MNRYRVMQYFAEGKYFGVVLAQEWMEDVRPLHMSCSPE
jgi:hypothetical protein